MTTLQSMPAGAVLVAIDIAKHRHEVLIDAPGRKRSGTSPPRRDARKASRFFFHRVLKHRLVQCQIGD